MRNKVILKLIFIAFFLTPFSCFAPNYTELFLKANEHYKKGEFKKAYKLYKDIPNPVSQVNYNLGNCAYKLDEYGYALLYWRKAERDWSLFNRTELVENITLLKNKLNKNTQNKSKFFEYLSSGKNYLFSIVRAAPLFVIQILFLVLWFFLFLYIKYLYKKKRKFLIIILFVLISILGSLLVIRYSLYYKHRGVVVSKKAILLSGPGKTFQKLGSLPEASEVLIQKESDKFYKIKFYKQIGWVNQNDVGKI